MKALMCGNKINTNIGLLLMRLTLGIGLAYGHGYGKLINSAKWADIGNMAPFAKYMPIPAVALGFMLESMNSVFQHERLSITYKKSANDLRESLNKINDSDNDVKKDENVFVEFVEDVENRISNEHKSWSLTTNSKNLPNF